MPRTNRVERAINNPNPVVGYMMLLQEKIKFLGRALVGCRCPDHERELGALHEELSNLQEEFQLHQHRFCRLQVSSQETFSNYRARIRSLLLANSSRLALHLCQSKAYKDEILSLRRKVRSLTNKLVSRRIRPPLPHPIPWVTNFDTFPSS